MVERPALTRHAEVRYLEGQPDAEYDYPSTENSPLVAQNTRAQTKKEFIFKSTKNYSLNYSDKIKIF